MSLAYYSQLADDIEENGLIETAKDIRELIRLADQSRYELRITFGAFSDLTKCTELLTDAAQAGQLRHVPEIKLHDGRIV